MTESLLEAVGGWLLARGSVISASGAYSVMLVAMPSARITVSLDEQLAEEVRQHAGAKGMSAWVAQAIRRQAERERLRSYLDELQETLGPADEALVEEFETVLSHVGTGRAPVADESVVAGG